MAIVISLWVSTEIDPAAAYRALVVAIVTSVALSFIACALLLDRDRGGLLASAFIVLGIEANNTLARLVLGAAIVVVLVEGLARRGRPLTVGPLLTRTLTALSVIVVLATVLNLIQSGGLSRGIDEIQRGFRSRGPVASSPAGRPDILVILLDAYPGDRAAERVPAFNPDALPSALGDLGFHVQRNSHSNYLFTPQTLASMFQMRHLVDVPTLGVPAHRTAAEDDRLLRQAMNDGEALDQLHSSGYQLIAIASGFSNPEIRHVDRYIDTGQPNEFELALLRGTGLGDVLTAVAPDLPSSFERDRISGVLDTLERLAVEPHDRPRFIFAHVPAPHAPWVFGPNGEPRRNDLASFYSDLPGLRGIDRDAALGLMFDQATYVGHVAEATIARVLAARADRSPVVVLFSDHGPGTALDFPDPLQSDLAERSSNFLATFTPGAPHLFDRFTTPVNIFPMLFNEYLGTQLPLAPDTIYGWRGAFLDLVDVTQQALAQP